MRKYLNIFYCVTICLAIGFLSGKVTQSSIETWYPHLKKPFFNPPNWVFAPVWTTLYILMGIAAGLIWNQFKENEKLVKKGLLYFFIQLGLNALWSILFFGLHNIALAGLEIVLLLLMIYETYVLFKSLNKIAGFLFIPYLVWVSFASILNWSYWWMNQ